jgi:hypothetical protein
VLPRNSKKQLKKELFRERGKYQGRNNAIVKAERKKSFCNLEVIGIVFIYKQTEEDVLVQIKVSLKNQVNKRIYSKKHYKKIPTIVKRVKV